MSAETIRLSVNINADCAEHLDVMLTEGVTATEVIRQALALHKCIHDGGRITLPGEGEVTS